MRLTVNCCESCCVLKSKFRQRNLREKTSVDTEKEDLQSSIIRNSLSNPLTSSASSSSSFVIITDEEDDEVEDDEEEEEEGEGDGEDEENEKVEEEGELHN